MGEMRVRFCFDVQCPFAFVASKRIEALAKEAGVSVEFFPVLLGGLYKDTNAPQGKDNSATHVMNANKKILAFKDLDREAKRWGVPLKMNPLHPVRSLRPQRILASLYDEPEKLAEMVKAFYSVYWENEGNVSDPTLLQALCTQYNVGDWEEREKKGREKLKENTTWASDRGVFGVPSMFLMEGEEAVDGRFYFGQDRTFFVGRALGLPKNNVFGGPLRLFQTPSPPPSSSSSFPPPEMTFYFDFGSPWAFLAAMQVQQIAEKHNSKLIYKPILLGALFKMVGTPNVPMLATSEAKRNYGTRDMNDWLNWWGEDLPSSFTFPSSFPIRTVQALRVTLLVQKNHPHLEGKVIQALFKATWFQNKNIGDENDLFIALTEGAKLSEKMAHKLILDAKTDTTCKKTLRDNTQLLCDIGGCGVPSFQVNEGDLIWGQDRLNVIEDYLVEHNLRNGAAKL